MNNNNREDDEEGDERKGASIHQCHSRHNNHQQNERELSSSLLGGIEQKDETEKDQHRNVDVAIGGTRNMGSGRLKRSDSDRSSSNNSSDGDDHNDGSEEGTSSSTYEHYDRHVGDNEGEVDATAAVAAAAERTTSTGGRHDRDPLDDDRPSVHRSHHRQRSHGHDKGNLTLHKEHHHPPLITIEEAKKRIKCLSREDLIDASRRALLIHLQKQFFKLTKANHKDDSAAAAAVAAAASSPLSDHHQKDESGVGPGLLSTSLPLLEKPSDGDYKLQNEARASNDKTNSGNTYTVAEKMSSSADDEEPVPTVEQLEIQARLQEKAIELIRDNPSLAVALLHLAAVASGMTQSLFYNPLFVQQGASFSIEGKKDDAAVTAADASPSDQVPQTVSAKVRPEDILRASSAAAASSGEGGTSDSNGSREEGSGHGSNEEQKTTNTGALSSLSSSVMYRSKKDTTSSSSGDGTNNGDSHKKKKEGGASGQGDKRKTMTGDVPSDTCYNSNEGRLSSLSSSNNNINIDVTAAQGETRRSPPDAPPNKGRTFIDASGGLSDPMSGLSASNSDPSSSTTGSSDNRNKKDSTKAEPKKPNANPGSAEGSDDHDDNRLKLRTSNLEGHLNRQGRNIAFKEVMQQRGKGGGDHGHFDQENKDDIFLGEESVSSGVTSEDGGFSSSLSGSSNTLNDQQASVSSDQAVCSRSSGSSGKPHHPRAQRYSNSKNSSPPQEALDPSRGKRRADKASTTSKEKQRLQFQDHCKVEWEHRLSERPQSSDIQGITTWLIGLFDLATLSQAASEAGITVTNSTRSSSNDGDVDNIMLEGEEEAKVGRIAAGDEVRSSGAEQSKEGIVDSFNVAAAAVGYSHAHFHHKHEMSSSNPDENESTKRRKTDED